MAPLNSRVKQMRTKQPDGDNINLRYASTSRLGNEDEESRVTNQGSNSEYLRATQGLTASSQFSVVVSCSVEIVMWRERAEG